VARRAEGSGKQKKAGLGGIGRREMKRRAFGWAERSKVRQDRENT